MTRASVSGPSKMAAVDRKALFAYVLSLADDALVLGHRLSEWSNQAPMLEEDIALSNLGLDLIGQARLFHAYAGEIEGKGRDEDARSWLARARPEEADFAEARYQLALLEAARGRTDAARAALSDALNAAPALRSRAAADTRLSPLLR